MIFHHVADIHIGVYSIFHATLINYIQMLLTKLHQGLFLKDEIRKMIYYKNGGMLF